MKIRDEDEDEDEDLGRGTKSMTITNAKLTEFSLCFTLSRMQRAPVAYTYISFVHH